MKKNEEGASDFSSYFATKIPSWQVGHIASLASRLEIVLSNEFPLLHSYIIEEKGVHSIDTLINSPENAFNSEIKAQLKTLQGNPLGDFKEAAKCLAFGFSTACGFHVVRAAEAVLRNWYILVDNDADFQTDWKGCVDGIRSKNKQEANEEKKSQVLVLLDVLDQIREIHRNPLMHPEVTLDDDESQFLFDLVKSAIFSMMKQVPSKKVST